MKHDAFILFSKRHLFLTTKCIQAIITSYKTCTLNKTRKNYPILQGVPEKMFLSEKGTLHAKEHFFLGHPVHMKVEKQIKSEQF